MPNYGPTFDTGILKNILPQLIQKVDLSSVLSLITSRINLSPDHYVDKAVNQLTTLRDQKLRVADMLDNAISFLENTDFSKFSPANGKEFSKPKINLSAEEVLGKTIEFLTSLKDYTANKPDLKDTFSNVFKSSNITDTLKNNIGKNVPNINLEDYTNKLSDILEALKAITNKQ